MKNYYLLCLLVTPMFIGAQTSNCDDANSYLVSAYSHVKDAYDSNNISHLKYYANRSVESFKLSKKTFNNCDCDTALELVDKGLDLLIKVADAPTFEDGRFYVKRARDISKESMIAIDKCSLNEYIDTASNTAVSETNTLSELQQEQLRLKEQQEALKLKEAEIKNKLALQEEQQLTLKKKQLVLSYNDVVSANIETYNKALNVCDCHHDEITETQQSEDIYTKNIKEIKSYYNNNLKELASNYLEALSTCN